MSCSRYLKVYNILAKSAENCRTETWTYGDVKRRSGTNEN